jgi:4-hydroxybenzoate polyprenyltransferase
MGACRFLNVILGASAVAVASRGLASEIWSMPQVQVAAGMGIYILGVTWFARSEAGRSSRGQLAAAMGGVNLGLAVLVHFVSTWPGKTPLVPTLLVLAVIILTINRRLAEAVFDPAPAKVQLAIKMMLMSLIMLDATLVVFATGVAAYGIATALLLVPGLVLSWWISVT